MKSLLLVIAFILASCSTATKEKNKSEPELLAMAYEYGFPLVLMDMTREVATNVAEPDSRNIRAPINQFAHAKQVPDSSFKDVVKINVDTLYSMAWLDLEKGPMVLEVPNTYNRYYMMPMMDGWTNVYNSPGKRTTGTEAHRFVIVGPKWKGDLPKELNVIHSPTNLSWIIGRTQVNGQEDAKNKVARIQSGYKLYPLSFLGKKYSQPKGQVDDSISMAPPIEKIFELSTDDFFNRLNTLLVSNPPSAEDQNFLKKFEIYGIGPGKIFTPDAIHPRELRLIQTLPLSMKKKFAKGEATFSRPKNGWITIRGAGNYGTDYAKRAEVAYGGLGANLDADALYPHAVIDGQGDKLDGENTYVLHFSKDQIPKVKGFWSLTVYGPDSFLVNNPINRYSLGDRSKLKYNADGSLDIYLQKSSPGKEKESNWLPIPDGEFSVAARLYWPKDEVKTPNWTLPPITPRIRSDISRAHSP